MIDLMIDKNIIVSMLTKNEIPISALMHIISRRYKQSAFGDLPQVDNTSVIQGQILSYLSLHNEVVPNDLSMHFHLTRATISGVLKRMEKKEYIKLIDNPKDKRSKIIVLLDKGKKINEDIMNRFISTEEILLAGLSQEELATLRELLLRLNMNIERSEQVD